MPAETLTPETIAREAAEELVVTTPCESVDRWTHGVGEMTEWSHSEKTRNLDREHNVRVVAAAVQAAIERALRVPPAPGGMSHERLEEIVARWRSAPDPGRSELHRQFGELINELMRVYALLRVYGDGEAAAFAAGFDAGRKARVSGRSPRDDLPCSWCEQIKPTTVNEVWSHAHPDGRLARLCEVCCGGCAGG